MKALSFVAAASSGVLFKSTAEDRILNHSTVLFPLPVGFLEKIGADMFMSIINETDLDLVRASLAFTLVTEIDWETINMEDPWFPYDWETGDLFEFPAIRGAINRSLGAD